jgi:hypothetical protein
MLPDGTLTKAIRIKKIKVTQTCSIPGCTEKYAVKGFCSLHYARKKTGRMLAHGICIKSNKFRGKGKKTKNTVKPVKAIKAVKITAVKAVKVCSILGCSRKHYAKGFCNLHYRQENERAFKNNPTLITRVCSIPGCERKHHGNGLCKLHNRRHLEGILSTDGSIIVKDRKCLIVGCTKHRIKKSVHCLKHTNRHLTGRMLEDGTLSKKVKAVKTRSIPERDKIKLYVQMQLF